MRFIGLYNIKEFFEGARDEKKASSRSLVVCKKLQSERMWRKRILKAPENLNLMPS